MNIADQLADLREHFPECEIAAFADLSSRLVLCVDSALRQTQESLDRICATASELLDGPLAAEQAGDDGGALAEGMVLVEDSAQIFLRSPGDGTEALCCACSADVDVAAFLDHARSMLEALGDR